MNTSGLLTIDDGAEIDSTGLPRCVLNEDALWEVVLRLPSLADVVHLACTSRRLYATSQAKQNWLEAVQAEQEPPEGLPTLRRPSWLERRMPEFYPVTFIYPQQAARRFDSLPLRKSRGRFWVALEQPIFNYLTGLISVQVEGKTRGGQGASYALGIDALIELIKKNSRLQFLSLFDSGDQGQGLQKIVRAVIQYARQLKFFYSESSATLADAEIYRLVAACPALEELALPNCPRKNTIAKRLGWPFVAAQEPVALEANLSGSKFPVVRHYGGQAGCNDWPVSARDVMRRPLDWKGLTAQQLLAIEKYERKSDGAAVSSSDESSSESSSGGSEHGF